MGNQGETQTTLTSESSKGKQVMGPEEEEDVVELEVGLVLGVTVGVTVGVTGRSEIKKNIRNV